jgi:hypothetical protein
MRTVVLAVAVTLGWSLIWLVALRGNIEIPGVKAVGVMRTFAVTPMDFIVSFWLVHQLRRNYAFANESMFGAAPIGFITSAGTLAAVLIFPLQAYFDYNQFPDRNFADVVVGDLPLLIFPWSVGTMTALLAQDSMWRSLKSAWMKRVMDGVIFGAGMVLAVLVIWAFHKTSHVPVMELLDKSSETVIVLGVFVTTFAFGFVIGYLVMARVRESASLSVVSKPVLSSVALART